MQNTNPLDILNDHQLTFQLINPSFQGSIDERQDDSINVLSLFSGCGGMDIGFEGGFLVPRQCINEDLSQDFIERKLDNGFIMLKKTRFKTVFANDILPEARNAWVNYFNKNHNITNYHTDSIVDLVKSHKKGIKVFPEKIDVVTGGFPCQDFSIAGKRRGFNSKKSHKGETIKNSSASIETRGQLYMWMKEVIEITKPKIFIAENVKGLVNLSNVKDIIQEDFSNADNNGYIVLNPRVLHSADFGVPQSRERVIFIGIRKNALKESALIELEKSIFASDYDPYPQPTHGFTVKQDNLKRPVQLIDIFSHLDEPEKSLDPSQIFYSKAKYMGSHCQGQTEIKLSSISPTIRAEHHGNIEFRRLSKENGGKIQNEIEKGYKERRLTPRECAMIQTFPPDYEFVIPKKNDKRTFIVSPSQAYRLIGNAVPPLLAYNLAKRIEKVWNLYFDNN